MKAVSVLIFSLQLQSVSTCPLRSTGVKLTTSCILRMASCDMASQRTVVFEGSFAAYNAAWNAF